MDDRGVGVFERDHTMLIVACIGGNKRNPQHVRRDRSGTSAWRQAPQARPYEQQIQGSENHADAMRTRDRECERRNTAEARCKGGSAISTLHGESRSLSFLLLDNHSLLEPQLETRLEQTFRHVGFAHELHLQLV